MSIEFNGEHELGCHDGPGDAAHYGRLDSLPTDLPSAQA